jgi:hypothetical protein
MQNHPSDPARTIRLPQPFGARESTDKVPAMLLRPNPRITPWLVLVLSGLICLCFWNWTERLLAPANTMAILARGEPLGNHSDLYPRWLGTRELFLHRRDPYSIEVTREIQSGFYGVALDKVHLYEPTNKESFVYPLYVSFLLAPTAHLPFATVQLTSRWLLLLLLSASVPLWMRAGGFTARLPYVLSGMILAASSSAAIVEFHQQNLAALVVFLLAAAAAAAARQFLVLCGALLALATIKPDTAGPVVLWFLLWSGAGWRQRKRLIASFAVTMSALVLAAQAVSPHWLGKFLSAVREYQAYGTDPSILQLLVPVVMAKLIAAGLVLALVVVCWRSRKAPAGSRIFSWALAWVATVTVVLLPRLVPYNQSLLVPALLMLVAEHQRIWKSGVLPRAAMEGAFACQAWQWAAAAFLAIWGSFSSATALQSRAGIPNYTALPLCPLTLLAVVTATFSLWRTDLSGADIAKS